MMAMFDANHHTAAPLDDLLDPTDFDPAFYAPAPAVNANMAFDPASIDALTDAALSALLATNAPPYYDFNQPNMPPLPSPPSLQVNDGHVDNSSSNTIPATDSRPMITEIDVSNEEMLSFLSDHQEGFNQNHAKSLRLDKENRDENKSEENKSRENKRRGNQITWVRKNVMGGFIAKFGPCAAEMTKVRWCYNRYMIPMLTLNLFL